MMKRWGYRFEDKEGLNYGKGRKAPLEVVNSRGWKDNRGLGYGATPDQSDVDSNPLASQETDMEMSTQATVSPRKGSPWRYENVHLLSRRHETKEGRTNEGLHREVPPS